MNPENFDRISVAFPTDHRKNSSQVSMTSAAIQIRKVYNANRTLALLFILTYLTTILNKVGFFFKNCTFVLTDNLLTTLTVQIFRWRD
jgi:hypothetical protein